MAKWRREDGSRESRWAILILGMLFTSAHTNYHDLTLWLAVETAVVPMWLKSGKGGGAWVVMGMVRAVFLAAVAWPPLAGGVTLAALVLLWRSDRRTKKAYAMEGI